MTLRMVFSSLSFLFGGKDSLHEKRFALARWDPI